MNRAMSRAIDQRRACSAVSNRRLACCTVLRCASKHAAYLAAVVGVLHALQTDEVGGGGCQLALLQARLEELPRIADALFKSPPKLYATNGEQLAPEGELGLARAVRHSLEEFGELVDEGDHTRQHRVGYGL